jgi:hypothetical protein
MTLTADSLLSVSKKLQAAKNDYECSCKRIQDESALYPYVNELAAKLEFAGFPVVGLYPLDIYCKFRDIPSVLRQIALLELQDYEFDYEKLELDTTSGQINLRVTNCPHSNVVDIKFVMADDATCKIVEHRRIITREVEEIERVVIC